VTISKALEQFLVSMVSFNAPIDQLKFRTDTLNVISASALRGLKLFLQPIEQGGADCFHCHSNMPFFGNNSFSGSLVNNGLDMVFTDRGLGSVSGLESDNGKFKIPSLRNVEVSAPYMHDGRFDNLEEVMDFYSSGIKLNSPNLDINILSHNAQLNLSTQQKEDIIEFLKTLTDQSFLTNPKFKSPF
jgi:cytochrome c peroxidase